MENEKNTLLRRYRWLRLATFLGLLILLFTLVLAVENLLLSSLLAFVMSYVLSPFVDWLERRGLSRLNAIVLVFASLTALFIVGVQALLPFVSAQFTALKTDLPKYIEGTTRLMLDIENGLTGIAGSDVQLDLGDRFSGILSRWADAFFQDLPSVVSKSLTVILLAPFLSFFLLKDGRAMSRSLLALVPNDLFEVFLNLHHQINERMGQFVRARILEAFIVGLVLVIGLWILNFPYAVLLATFGALTNLIPYIGPVIGAIPALAIALINGHPPIAILMVALVFFIAQLIDVVFIIPLVVAKIVNLHPITVVVSLLVGSQVLGVIGMLIAIPVASILKLTFTSLYQHMIQFRA